MFFFLRKSKIVVDCFTPYRSVYEAYSIQPSIKFFPENIKNINSYKIQKEPNTNIDIKISTIKRCVGLIEYYKHGFIIPMWSDFICQPKTFLNKESALGAIASPFNYVKHSTLQYEETGMFDNYIHAKFGSPWKIREKTGIKFTWNSCNWNLYQYYTNFSIPPAILSFDIPIETNVNIFIFKESENFTLHAGTPLVHLVPMSDKDVKISTHLVSDEEYNKIGIPTDFCPLSTNRYMRYKKVIEKQTKKCPFGFGNETKMD